MKSTRTRGTAVVWACAAVLSGALLAACGGGKAGSTGGAGGHGAGGNDGGGGTDLGGGGGLGVGGGGGGIDEHSACATSAVEGKKIPVTMLIMFDKSGSMLEDQKWAGAKAALIAFFQDPESAGASVGLRFFPDDAPVPGCDDKQCSIDACSKPLVPPAPLVAAGADGDPQEKALVDAVNSKNPAGETPMFAALGGAEAWAMANAKGDTQTVVILATDGEPTTCNTDVDAIAALAKDAHDKSGVLTYAFGMPGSNQTQLDKIAAGGGTQKAILADAGEVVSKLGAALASIQKAKIACAFDLPGPSKPGDMVDPGKVNVNYYDGTGAYETIPRYDSLAACTDAPGWYYDDPMMPKQIHLCPTTCKNVQNNPDALIKILLGCATIVK
jgi:hypothetical protein